MCYVVLDPMGAIIVRSLPIHSPSADIHLRCPCVLFFNVQYRLQQVSSLPGDELSTSSLSCSLGSLRRMSSFSCSRIRRRPSRMRYIRWILLERIMCVFPSFSIILSHNQALILSFLAYSIRAVRYVLFHIPPSTLPSKLNSPIIRTITSRLT